MYFYIMTLDKYIVYNENLKMDMPMDIIEIFQYIHENPTHTLYKLKKDQRIKINNNIVLNIHFICHRVNTIEQLKVLENQPFFGVELDVRDDPLNPDNQIHIAHDAFHYGDNFEKYVKLYSQSKYANKKTMIVNVKSEQVEYRCMDILEKYNMTNYFFLDSSFPMIYKLNRLAKPPRIACRYSEYEPMEIFKAQESMVSDIWIDCFTKFPLDILDYSLFRLKKKRICLVSPELQGQPEKIEEYRKQVFDNVYKTFLCDSICCKIYHIIDWI